MGLVEVLAAVSAGEFEKAQEAFASYGDTDELAVYRVLTECLPMAMHEHEVCDELFDAVTRYLSERRNDIQEFGARRELQQSYGTVRKIYDLAIEAAVELKTELPAMFWQRDDALRQRLAQVQAPAFSFYLGSA